MKVSCHVNDMITKGGHSKEPTTSAVVGSNAKPAEKIDFDKLAENRLVNELLGRKHHHHHHRAKATPGRVDAPSSGGQPSHEHVSSSNSNSTGRRRGSIAATLANLARNSRKGHTTTESHKTTGLHPKLNQKLDYVINEGVLDSVLPFICPIPFPNQLIRHKVKHKEKQQGDGTFVCGDCDRDAGVGDGDGGDCMARMSVTRRSQLNMKKDPEVVIHVCDEIKNITRDFACPQRLLISKMGYFATVTAGQTLDEMDISVHCDVQIFDWLMKWLKYNDCVDQGIVSKTSLDSGPHLDAHNVVPILISASFLQMEPLMLDCLSYCHAHLNEVVRSPTNLSCLNDCLVSRLASMFTNMELEMVRDKKERMTPRLWTKLIQSLIEPEPEALRGHFYSLSGLFRCAKCGKCLTNTMKTYIPCLPSNVRLNRWGQLVSHHVRDSSWDINVYILQLFKELKSWRKVYWKLWGHCHFLYCCICEKHFPVFQMTWCRYHTESPNFLGPITEGRIAGPTGRYPCCGQQAFRFETLPGPNGCQYRDHSVLVENDRERTVLSIAQMVAEGMALYENPPGETRMQDGSVNVDFEPRWAGLMLLPSRNRQGLIPTLNPEESTAKMARRARHGAMYYDESSSDTDSSDVTVDQSQSKKYIGGASPLNHFSSSSDGCESEISSPKTTGQRHGKPRHVDIPGRFWAGGVSARSNQDHQREFEEKVMKQVSAIVSCSETNVGGPQPLGGAYVRLEADFKEQQKNRITHATALLHKHRQK